MAILGRKEVMAKVKNEPVCVVAELNEMYSNLKQGLLIDRNALDDELEVQSQKFHEVYEAHVRAISIRDEFKQASDEQYANSALKIRLGLEKSQERYTEAGVKEQVATDEAYLQSCSTYLSAKNVADKFQSLVSAYDMRAKMIKELAQLYNSGYFTAVRHTGTNSKVKQVEAEQGKEALAAGRAPLKKFGR